jgi:ResB-like family
MSQTAIQTSPDPKPQPDIDVSVARRKQPQTVWEWVKYVLRPIASLRLTVVLFALSIFLVFCGTLAQVEMGLWTTMDTYFRSAFVLIPFQLFVQFGKVFFHFPREWQVAGSFPFPGGWLLGGLLLANLLAAHLVRFKCTWRRSGILLIHAGLIIMMLSELVTGLFAVESRMTIAEGETVNFIDVQRQLELALTDPSNPKFDDVVVVPAWILKKGGRISTDDLPVDIEVVEYMDNSSLDPLEGGANPEGPTFRSAVGSRFKLTRHSEESGAASEKSDFPSVRVRFLEKGTGKPLETEQSDREGVSTLSLWFYWNATSRIPFYQFAPQHVKTGGKTWTVELRPRRVYQPFRLHLIKFTHKKYIGTNTPKDFSSLVQVTDPSRHEDRQVKISMNEPLRYAGETFYQAGFFPNEKGTILQVVNNPGWLMPYISCVIVALGMIFHFGLHLVEFLQRRVA